MPNIIGLAAGAGLLIGAGTYIFDPTAEGTIASRARAVGVSGGFVRAREPQAGDYWSGCNAAKAAGTAPIYIGEPGYREGMDGDGDGIACEPYRGR
ncbi:excalibur calcium-binding domain-containing protein [Croceicoccus pelagius]|uniref:Excalibur calcium-binding domain-containing protein n=1 Tax=Croceicoccus pelagius TaxID=1703341 RepID=A0A916YH91_9SPHN|nr:excalibur calcium-binding domain-containing protein [Croceicoccus pelagius]GGD45570.1 hypothetical protein GCM10010989_19660 [Croceicoccus pelagius]